MKSGITIENDAILPAHKMACSNQDFDFFYSGLEDRTLLVQRCASCSKLRNPPAPICSSCGSFDWSAKQISGLGTIHSYVIHHHPPLPGFEVPHAVLVVDMEEGIRFVGAGTSGDRQGLAIGRSVAVEFIDRNDMASFQFALVPEGQ